MTSLIYGIETSLRYMFANYPCDRKSLFPFDIPELKPENGKVPLGFPTVLQPL